LADVPKANI